jgi:hypothetical protein
MPRQPLVMSAAQCGRVGAWYGCGALSPGLEAEVKSVPGPNGGRSLDGEDNESDRRVQLRADYV